MRDLESSPRSRRTGFGARPRSTRSPACRIARASTRCSARAAAGQSRGALVFADLDRFKTLNDTLGHPAGDAALVHFARILTEQIRGGDIAARAGGEEFAVWLPDTALETGMRIAERIRIKLGHHTVGVAGQELALERLVRRGGAVRRRAPAAGRAVRAGGRGTLCRKAKRAESGGAGGRRRRRAGGRARKCAGRRRCQRHCQAGARAAIFAGLSGATGFDGFVEGMAACPGPEPW